jgi:hypothetical protein
MKTPVQAAVVVMVSAVAAVALGAAGVDDAIGRWLSGAPTETVTVPGSGSSDSARLAALEKSIDDLRKELKIRPVSSSPDLALEARVMALESELKALRNRPAISTSVDATHIADAVAPGVVETTGERVPDWFKEMATQYEADRAAEAKAKRDLEEAEQKRERLSTATLMNSVVADHLPKYMTSLAERLSLDASTSASVESALRAKFTTTYNAQVDFLNGSIDEDTYRQKRSDANDALTESVSSLLTSEQQRTFRWLGYAYAVVRSAKESGDVRADTVLEGLGNGDGGRMTGGNGGRNNGGGRGR